MGFIQKKYFSETMPIYWRVAETAFHLACL